MIKNLVPVYESVRLNSPQPLQQANRYYNSRPRPNVLRTKMTELEKEVHQMKQQITTINNERVNSPEKTQMSLVNSSLNVGDMLLTIDKLARQLEIKEKIICKLTHGEEVEGLEELFNKSKQELIDEIVRLRRREITLRKNTTRTSHENYLTEPPFQLQPPYFQSPRMMSPNAQSPRVKSPPASVTIARQNAQTSPLRPTGDDQLKIIYLRLQDMGLTTFDDLLIKLEITEENLASLEQELNRKQETIQDLQKYNILLADQIKELDTQIESFKNKCDILQKERQEVEILLGSELIKVDLTASLGGIFKQVLESRAQYKRAVGELDQMIKQYNINQQKNEIEFNQMRDKIRFLEEEMFYYEEIKQRYSDLGKRNEECDKHMLLVVLLSAEIESLRARLQQRKPPLNQQLSISGSLDNSFQSFRPRNTGSFNQTLPQDLSFTPF